MVHEGTLYRFGRSCDPSHAERVSAYRVVDLTAERFAEVRQRCVCKNGVCKKEFVSVPTAASCPARSRTESWKFCAGAGASRDAAGHSARRVEWRQVPQHGCSAAEVRCNTSNACLCASSCEPARQLHPSCCTPGGLAVCMMYIKVEDSTQVSNVQVSGQQQSMGTTGSFTTGWRG